MFMKKIGILLSSPKDIGGIFQYSLSIINSLKNFKKKKFKRFKISILIKYGKSIFQKIQKKYL